MYNDIEKSDLTVVKDDISCQPNVIRLKPSSKAAILLNELSVTVSTKNINDVKKTEKPVEVEKEAVVEEPVVEEKQVVIMEDQQLGETRTANLFRMGEDTVKQESKAKPIKLNRDMISTMLEKLSTMFKKCDEKVNAYENVQKNDEVDVEKSVEDDEELDNIFAAIDAVAEDDAKVETESGEYNIDKNVDVTSTDDYVGKLENTERIFSDEERIDKDHQYLTVENSKNLGYLNEGELIQASNVAASISTNEFVNLINAEVQLKHDVVSSEERLENTNSKLEISNANLRKEIMNNYELKMAVEKLEQQQENTMISEAKKVRDRIQDYQTTKAALEMENEQRARELEKTNKKFAEVQEKNADLLDIYNGIMNSIEEEKTKVA